ncbi:MAG: CvpA family protein, partial [Actinomycetota bacterium]|nr:CvpA family protein [Actinomycetota bacterium]
MNVLDLLLVLLLLSGVSAGYRLGFVTRVASWGGLAFGIVVAALVLPPLLRRLGAFSSLSRLLITLVLFFIITSIAGSFGEVMGRRVRGRIPAGAARSLDRMVGAVAGILGTLVLVWLLAPIAAEVPGVVAQQVRNSVVTNFVTAAAPPPPEPIRSLRRLVAQTPFPEVFSGLRPTPEMGAPPGQLPV